MFYGLILTVYTSHFCSKKKHIKKVVSTVAENMKNMKIIWMMHQPPIHKTQSHQCQPMDPQAGTTWSPHKNGGNKVRVCFLMFYC